MLLRAYLRSASAPSSTRIRHARSMALAMVHARAIQIWPNASGRTRISRDAITHFWLTSEPVGAASWNCSAITMVTARPAQNWRSSRVNTGFLTFDPYWVTRTRATTRSSHGFEGRQASLSRRVTPAAATASGAGCRSSLFVRSFGCGIPCQRGISARFSRKPSFRHCQYISKDVVITRFLHQTISSLFSTFLDLFGLRHGAVDAHLHKAHMDQIITSVRVIEWE